MRDGPPIVLDETAQAIPSVFVVGSVVTLTVKIPECPAVWVEIESQDIGVTFLANPWSESALPGRQNVIPASLQGYRWAADCGPAGSKARFPVVAGQARTFTVYAILQQGYATACDPTNGHRLNGVPPSPRVVARVWDGDPLWLEYWSPNPTIINGPSGYVNHPQTGAGLTTIFGYPPGYARWFAGYGNNGCQWQIGAPDGTFLVANVVNQRVSSGINPMCDVRMLNGGGAATQGSLTWSTQPIAI